MTLAGQVGSSVFKLGADGEIVRAIQMRLRDLGYALKGTGYFGSATDTAVSAFQKREGLKADGVVGLMTARALDAALADATTNETPPEVKAEIGRPLWLEAGLKFIGTREGVGKTDNATIIDWAKDEGGAIAKSYKEDSIPWCALFANMILTKVGLKGTESLWALDFADARKWPGVDLGAPAVGAFVPMLRDGGGHIAVVVGRDQNGNIMCLGGNQSDAVNIKPFARSRLNKGYWWPESVPHPASVGFNTLPLVTSDGKVSSKEV